jgi:site-specific DNA-cytosine methylase
MGLKMLGITSGIGSLMYGPYKLGFKPIAAYEWRKYYNTGTFEKNFKAPYITDYGDKDSTLKGVDLICSHPECGNFSNLYTGKNAATRQLDPADIHLFTDLCSYYQPKYFICDNLPKSLLAVTPGDWRQKFKDYKIDFCWVSNWGYGNSQRNRKRLFIIGVHKDIKWSFVPQEFQHNKRLEDAISGISSKTPGHGVRGLNPVVLVSSGQTKQRGEA